MIDPKGITIGSHVLFNGERVEVRAIDTHHDEDAPMVVTVHEVIASGEYDIPCEPVELDPIPITEELLTEIAEKYATLDYGRTYFEKYDGYTYFNIWLNDEYLITGTIDTEHPNEFDVDILKYSGNEFVDDDIVVTANKVQYLHILESLIYLTTKQHLL